MSRLPSLVVCGAARNAAAEIPATLRAIGTWLDASEGARCVVVTNDNEDATDRVLDEWRSDDPRVTVHHLDGLSAAYPSRLERLAAARNFYLHDVRRGAQPEIVIVLDLDGINDAVTPDDLAAAIGAGPSGWSALFANQLPAYYDLLALRRKGWVEDDCWRNVTLLREQFQLPAYKAINKLTGKRLARALIDQAERRDVRDKQVRIDRLTPPIEVDSAFGGLGLYRAPALAGSWYGTRDYLNRLVCDHVALHEAMRARGARLYIQPSLLNRAPAEHVNEFSGLHRFPSPA